MRRRVLTIAIFLLAGAALTGEEASTKSGRKVTTAHHAVDRAIKILGAPRELASTAEAELVILETDDTPFLHEQVVGRPLWEIVIPKWKLKFKSAKGAEDAFERTFDVLVDPENGNVLRVASRWPQGVAGEPLDIPAQSAEDQMGRRSEKYHGFPAEAPRITFAQALEVVYGPGVGNPLVAKRITGRYVVQSAPRGGPSPVWAITLEGIKRQVPSPPGSRPRSISRIRNIVDARTGEWLRATTIPRPITENKAPSPPRQPPGKDPPPGDFP